MQQIIQPRLLRGFRDFLPPTALARKRIQEKLAEVFALFGFLPIDTPALEYAEILLGKGGGETDKLVYRFLDHGKRDVALRFDLTIPFARFMALHRHELTLPFKRYHIGKVWRGENTQAGRYREFTQIDFDIVGVDSASADFEILLLMQNSLSALGIEEFKIHLSHRGLFTRLLEKLKVAGDSLPVLRAIDKLPKLGREKVAELLEELCSPGQARTLLELIQPEPSFGQTLDKLRTFLGPESEAMERLVTLQRCVQECGLEAHFAFNPSIARGLDYYTGVVFETFLLKLPRIGSVCSGGRYNNLASLYTEERLPGVGSSIGLDRLLAALEELRLLGAQAQGPQLIILFLEPSLLASYHRLASRFREAAFAVEVFPEPRKLALQFAFAEKRGIPLALICGETEHRQGTLILKDLGSRKSYKGLSLEEALRKAGELLKARPGS